MIEINLLPEELRGRAKRSAARFVFEQKYFLYLIPLLLCLMIITHIALALLNIIRVGQYNMLNKKWQGLVPQRAELEEANRQYDILSQDIRGVQQLTAERIEWSPKLNKLSLCLPPGVWFNEIRVSEEDFVLYGSTVSLQEEEISLIKKFIDNLKSDEAFFKDFKNVELNSVKKKNIGGYEIADFTLIFTPKSKI